MAHLRGSRRRYWIAPLLIALAIGRQSAAAPSSPGSASREIRVALERGESARVLLARTDAALARATSEAAAWDLRILRAELLIRNQSAAEGYAILEEQPPPALRTNAAAVYRLILLARRNPPTDAPKYLPRAHVIAAKHHPQLLPVVMVNEINFRTTSGNLQAKAMEAIRLAQAYGDASAEARVRAAYAYQMLQQERFADSVPWLQSAWQLAQRHGFVPILANIEGNLGYAYYELGDLEVAADYYASAVAANQRQGLIGDSLQWVNNIGNIHVGRREWPEARARYLQALSLAQRGKKDWQVAHALANLGVVALEMGHHVKARLYTTEALRQKRNLKDREGVWRSQITDARLAALENRNADAVKLLEKVGARATHLAVRWEALGRVAPFYAAMSKDDLAEARFRRALSTIGKARRAIDSAELRLSFLTNAADILGSYLDFLIARNRIDDALAATETYRAATLEEGLRSSSGQKLDPSAVAKKSGATILSYWLGSQQSYLWVIRPGDVRLYKLAGETKINDLVARYQKELHAAVTSPLASRSGRELYKLLVAPAGNFPKDERVIVIPDGRLHALNFETLIVPGRQGRFWIEDVTLANAGSLQLLAREVKKTPASPTMLLVGDPPRPDPAFPLLPHAQREIALIARHFRNPVLLSGQKATPAAFQGAKPGTFDYLHFVAHGVATRQKPLDSAVILARAGSAADYRLTARDIIKTPLNARLVTISSCHGAGTRTYVGEGLVGLAWAFLRAGAGQVIAALWEVNDKAAPDLMDSLYAGIRAGKEPAVALRDAKLKLLRSGKIYQNPIYWAPFILYSGS